MQTRISYDLNFEIADLVESYSSSSHYITVPPPYKYVLTLPFAAGGPSDAMARILAERMAVKLGQNILIENVTGAAGSIEVKAANVKVE